MNLKPLLIIGFIQVLPFPIYPQEARETKKEVFSADTEQKTELVLHFRFDRSMVDYGYRDNNRILAAMHKIFADSLCVSRIPCAYKPFPHPKETPITTGVSLCDAHRPSKGIWSGNTLD